MVWLLSPLVLQNSFTHVCGTRDVDNTTASTSTSGIVAQIIGNTTESTCTSGNVLQAAVNTTVGTNTSRGFTSLGGISVFGFDDGATMADDNAFAKPIHLEQLKTTACDDNPTWRAYRQDLLYLAEQSSSPESLAVDYRMASWHLLTDAFPVIWTQFQFAQTCFFGFVTAQYHYIRANVDTKLQRSRALEEDRKSDSAILEMVSFMRMLDHYVQTMHPDLFDSSVRGIWPISNYEIGTLERDFAMAMRIYQPEEGSTRIRYFDFEHEETFRVYVYDPSEVPELKPLLTGSAFCKSVQWGVEVQLHYFFLQSHVFTENPAEADYFFVPQYTACHLNANTYTEEQSDDYFKKLIPKLPYFRKAQGRDHIFVFTSGMGVDGPFRSWRNYIKDSLFLMTETELWNPYHDIAEPSFSVHKDIVIPGITGLELLQNQARTNVRRASKKFIADFVGWSRPLHVSQHACAPEERCASPRERLLMMENYTDLHIRKNVPYRQAVIGSGFSHFCFIPRGKSSWSSRLFRVMFAGCVPVLLNDYYEVPFAQFLNIQDWMIKWPMKNLDGDKLVSALKDLVDNGDTLEVMAQGMLRDRCWYVYPPSIVDASYNVPILETYCPEWRTQNAFLGIMRLLARKVWVSKNSPDTFFFPMENNVFFVDNLFHVLQ